MQSVPCRLLITNRHLRDRENIQPAFQRPSLARVDLTERLRSDYFEWGRGKATSTKAR
jgi:hypothetical protein